MTFRRTVFGILISLLALPLGANQEVEHRNQNSTADPTVILILGKTEFASRESIPLKVQISNLGDEPLLVGNLIDWGSAENPTSRIEIELRDEQDQVIRPIAVITDDAFLSKKYANPASAFLSSYLLLYPGYSLSTQHSIIAKRYGGLKPGSYRLSGTYTSNGLFYPPVYNQAGLSDEDVKSVPFKAWRGKVSTNEVRFKITQARAAH